MNNLQARRIFNEFMTKFIHEHLYKYNVNNLYQEPSLDGSSYYFFKPNTIPDNSIVKISPTQTTHVPNTIYNPIERVFVKRDIIYSRIELTYQLIEELIRSYELFSNYFNTLSDSLIKEFEKTQGFTHKDKTIGKFFFTYYQRDDEYLTAESFSPAYCITAMSDCILDTQSINEEFSSKVKELLDL